MLQVKILKSVNEKELEKEINEFLTSKTSPVDDLIDIKFSTFGYPEKHYENKENYTAMIIYKQNIR